MGSLHGSIVGLEGCDELSGGEVPKRSPLERIHALQKSFPVINLSLPVDGSEDYKIFVQGLGADSLLARSTAPWSS